MGQQQQNICAFISSVLWKHYNDFEVEKNDFVEADLIIKRSHDPEATRWTSFRARVDYDQPAYRCVYLHRYAAIHAAAVWYILLQNSDTLWNLSSGHSCTIKICCLGGGPGTDVVGISAALSSLGESSGKIFHFTTVDSVRGWNSVQTDITTVADPMEHGRLGWFLSRRVSNSFICDDVLRPSLDTIEAIESADMVTMVKFISMVHQGLVVDMLENVFLLMKPGALLLFVDNSGGGVLEMAEHAAESCGLVEVGTSFRNKYENPIFDHKVFGVESRSSIRVAMKMWQKPKPPLYHQESERLQFHYL